MIIYIIIIINITIIIYIIINITIIIINHLLHDDKWFSWRYKKIINRAFQGSLQMNSTSEFLYLK